MKTDIATNLYFPKELYADMKKISKKLGISIAEYVRQVVQKDIESRIKEIDWENDPLWDIIGIGETKESDISINHDHYLYGGQKKEK
ncbi:MAG TPA: ribbon-helix-helix domain-containing protein [bacterium]|nr:ribbon-helix-helix domain-containing protein [bacterium]